MTRYTVTWRPQALRDLDHILARVADSHSGAVAGGGVTREAVYRAVDGIDERLAEDAPSKGAVGDDALRILHVEPLDVLFQVSEEDRLVTVISVKLNPLYRRAQTNGQVIPPSPPA
jgi:plasmid stabilization system protein ParE